MKVSNWEKTGLQQDSNPWPLLYCAMLYQLSYEATLGVRSIYWAHIFPCSEMMWSLYEIIHICTAVVDESGVIIAVVTAVQMITNVFSERAFMVQVLPGVCTDQIHHTLSWHLKEKTTAMWSEIGVKLDTKYSCKMSQVTYTVTQSIV